MYLTWTLPFVLSCSNFVSSLSGVPSLSVTSLAPLHSPTLFISAPSLHPCLSFHSSPPAAQTENIFLMLLFSSTTLPSFFTTFTFLCSVFCSTSAPCQFSLRQQQDLEVLVVGSVNTLTHRLSKPTGHCVPVLPQCV